MESQLGKVAVTVGAGLLLAVLTGFATDYIAMRERVTLLERDASADERQDAELQDLRATLRDVMLLSRFSVAPTSVKVEPDVQPASAPAAFESEYREFRDEQMDLETLLREKGLEPTEKPEPRERVRGKPDESRHSPR